MKYFLWFIGIVILVAVGIVVYTYTPRLGAEQNNTTTDSVVVFFTRMTDTDMEFVSVDREIVQTNVFEEMVKRTLQELIKGPTAEEARDGLSVSFNSGTEINYVKISGNTLTVDFNEKFDIPMGGSARVRSISQTIDRTIRQFPIDGIDDIKLTVNNGEREAVLEP
ncbi:MAG: GerMN domain-containing protein [Patescibacteria group bacterium]|jgi:spore germination protein GerM